VSNIIQYKQKQTNKTKQNYLFRAHNSNITNKKKKFYEHFDVFFFPYVGNCCWFSPLLREVFLRVLRFSSLRQKPTFSNSSSTRNQIDEEPLCGCATSKSLFIYLQLTKFTKMNVWVYYLYWSNKYPVGPDDPICRVATMKRNQT